MERRDFGKIAMAGALSGGLLRSVGRQWDRKERRQASYAGLGRPPMKWGIKHAMQIRDLRPDTLQLVKQLGMEWVDIWSSPDQYMDIVQTVRAAGLKVADIGNDSVHNQPAIVLGLPGRDEKIEEFQQNLRALAAVGIKIQQYAHMVNGGWSTASESGRGGAICRAFDERKPAVGPPNSTFERNYSEQELWDNWDYFVRRIAPVAEETGVKIGIHPDDPPGLTLGNVRRPIFSSFEGYKRALEIANSPNVGIGLCCGTWLEGGPRMGKNVLETIEYFGALKKLFFIHFRNVDAPLPHFRETYLSEGCMDMYKIMRALRKVNFDGMIIGDHFPAMVTGELSAQIYTIGYTQALIERANEEFLRGTSA